MNTSANQPASSACGCAFEARDTVERGGLGILREVAAEQGAEKSRHG